MGHRAKAGVFVVAFDVVAVEAYLLVENHDQNHGYSATSDVLAINVAASEEAPPRDRSGSAGSISPVTLGRHRRIACTIVVAHRSVRRHPSLLVGCASDYLSEVA